VFSVVAILVAVVVVQVRLRPDPLLVARERAGQAAVVRTGTSWSRVREVAAHNRGVGAGMLAISAGHAVMVGVMVMTPLHMHHGGAELEVIGLVVSVHVLGMYFFSPMVGWAADAWGHATVLAAGAVILVVSMVLSGTAPEGASWQIGAGLLLLGVGWSCSTVAGSAMLTESTPLAARTDVQGAADLCMNASAAIAGALAGVVMDQLGFGALNVFGAVLSAGVLVAVVLARRGPRIGAPA
jgi:MFS family permease